mgnify:FL=1
MIVGDTSASVAISAGENEALAFSDRISADGEPILSAGTLLELTLVLRGLGENSRLLADSWIDRLVVSAGFRIEPVTETQVTIARDAHRRYGKGMGHPAQLNFGDCFSYALAKSLNVPLLYKGGDFAMTDIASAI